MLATEYQSFICEIIARRFELPSMLRISNLQIKSIEFRAFIAPKTDKKHSVEF